MRRSKFLNSKHNSINGDVFDYGKDGNIMKNTISSHLYKNQKISGFLDQISNIYLHCINYTKNIKRWFIISVDPDDDTIN